MTEQKNFTVFISLFAGNLASIMNAPEEAYDLTVSYIRICGAGAVVIISYNLIGSIFRGLGDSVTPLITVHFSMEIFCPVYLQKMQRLLLHRGITSRHMPLIACLS